MQSHFTVFFAYLIGYLQAGSEENAFVNRQGDAPKRYTLEDGRDLCKFVLVAMFQAKWAPLDLALRRIGKDDWTMVLMC